MMGCETWVHLDRLQQSLRSLVFFFAAIVAIKRWFFFAAIVAIIWKLAFNFDLGETGLQTRYSLACVASFRFPVQRDFPHSDRA